jgi:uncharacterized protein
MLKNANFVFSLILLVAATAIVIVTVSVNAPDGQEREFSVQGEGRVFAIPDVAEINLGVRVEDAKTAQAATRRGVDQMNAVVAAIKTQGVADKDIKTTQYNLYPNYDYTRFSGQELSGWNLDQNVRVKVRKLDDAGAVIAAATEAGANQAGNINFTIDDEETLKAEARTEAIEQAKNKAKELARKSGLRLGKVINVIESQSGYPVSLYARSEALDAGFGGGLPVPEIQPGENEIVVNMTLIYEVK